MENYEMDYGMDQVLADLGSSRLAVNDFSDAIAVADSYEVGKYDEVGLYGGDPNSPVYTMVMEADGLFTPKNSSLQRAQLTRQALSQLVNFSRTAGATDLRLRYFADSGLPTRMVTEQLNYWLTGRAVTARYYDNGVVPVVRSFASQRWNVNLNNADILRSLYGIETGGHSILENSYGQPIPLRPSSYVSVNDMSLKMRIPNSEFYLPDRPDGSQSRYDVGMYLTGSEDGTGALRMTAGFFRGPCDNSFVVTTKEMPNTYWTHASTKSPVMVAQAMAETLYYSFLREGDNLRDEFIASIEANGLKQLDDSGVLAELASFGDMFNLPADEVSKMNMISGGYSRNPLGVANAITEYASRPEVDTQLASRLEQSAGNYLMTGFFRLVGENAEAIAD